MSTAVRADFLLGKPISVLSYVAAMGAILTPNYQTVEGLLAKGAQRNGLARGACDAFLD